MNSASKVGAIFVEAGESFTRLGNMTMQLQQASPNATNSGKWGEEEIHLLHEAVNKFGPDPQKIAETLKTRSASQIRNALKTKAFEGVSGLTRTPARPVPAVARSSRPVQVKQESERLVKSDDLTLNMLNASAGDAEAMRQDYIGPQHVYQVPQDGDSDAKTYPVLDVVT